MIADNPYARGIVPNVRRLATWLRGAGGTVAWVVPGGDDPLPANSCIFVGPEDAAFVGASGPVGAELLCLQFRRRARD